MGKRVIMFALAGYLLALVIPPRELLSRVRG